MDAYLFIFALVDSSFLLFLSVYFIITLSDLECDYINATQCSSRLNKWVLVEVIAHSIATVSMLVSFHYVLFLFNVPMFAWQIYRYINKPSGNIGWYDPTEIYNRHKLKTYMKESLVKLAIYLVLFFLYLYNMIVALISHMSSD